MDTKQYLLNNNHNTYNANNRGFKLSPLNINTNNPQNNAAPPEEIYQYPNSADFPQYNQIVNSIQPQIDYSKYSNLNQLNHRGIKQTSENTFYLPEKCCSCARWGIVIIFLFSFSFCFILLLDITVGTVIFAIFGFIMSCLGMIGLCTIYFSVYFVLNPNNIKVILIAWCGRKSLVYERGQITQIIFNSSSNSDDRGKNFYVYELNIKQNIPGENSVFNIFSKNSGKQLYTEEEIGYFNYIMNHHIQSKLNYQNMN